MKRIHRLIFAGACALALAIGVAACGGSSDNSSSSSTPAASGSGVERHGGRVVRHDRRHRGRREHQLQRRVAY